MNIINRLLRRAAAFACLLTLAAGFSTNAFAVIVYSKTVQWTGQGVMADGMLNTELCGKANGAEVDGPYLLWVLTASGATNATITGPWVPGPGTQPMIQSGNGHGSFKFVSNWIDPASLLTPPGVYATYYYTGSPPANPQLVISHGCRPFTTSGAWCSPGFWKHALTVSPTAWTLIYSDLSSPPDVTPDSFFNDTVVPDFYDTALGSDPTLDTVLTTIGGTYKGPASGPFIPGLTPFNATGAFLTSLIPGFDFDPSLIGSGNDDDSCPIDPSGHFKIPTN